MNCQCKACFEVMGQKDKTDNYDGEKSCPNCGGLRFIETALPKSDRYTQRKYEMLLNEISKAEGFVVNDEPSYKIEKDVVTAGTRDAVVIELQSEVLYINEKMLRAARIFEDESFMVVIGEKEYMIEVMYH